MGFVLATQSQLCHYNCRFHHYIKIIVVRCPSVCLSVTEGHQKRFDLEASVAVYLAMERTKIKLGDLCEQQSWHLPQVKALTSWTDYTKTSDNGLLHVVGCR